jgi:phage shock protein PspC (stress-responsive transcriptional regulator)
MIIPQLWRIFICYKILGYIAGGALWYFDISDQPLSYVFVLPAFIILFGIGIAYVGFKIIENHCQSEKKPTTKK